SEISTGSSPEVSQIINDYTDYAVLNSEEQNVRIVPELSIDDDYLIFKLKIGREKTYVVSDLYNLLVDFQYNNTRKYGKNFVLRHNYSAIDEKSRKFLELATSIYFDERNRSNDRKHFPLVGEYVERFLEIFKDDPLIIDGKQYEIEYQNPPIDIVMTTDDKERMLVTIKHSLLYLGYSANGYFVSEATSTLYISDTDFKTKVCPFMQLMPDSNTLYIGKEDIPSFYNAVIKQIDRYVNIESSELPDDIVPPPMNACLYIDVNSDDEICGRLEYMYDDKIYPAFYDNSVNPFCDHPSEMIALNSVKKYFEVNEGDDTHPFIIRDENGIFEFISKGVSLLSKTMVLYVSDRFKRINVRQPVRASVGVRTSSGLLELNFGAEGYTKAELLELLKAYRLGRKYYRFKDGSFSLINESMDELMSVTKELNITDKMFLKDHISVPMYRMIYLNSLQSNLESMRISRSRDFKRLIESYENSLNFDEEQSVPESLEGIMRDYQKIGFEWFKTLSKYRLGGILQMIWVWEKLSKQLLLCSVPRRIPRSTGSA
ncbi:MAG: SNF2 helicase associated domain-containing protein, partial [Clostridia bacterium]|nr:SNF2 helicase associated domain-containing protein [Clostridia bacterium]